MKRKVTIHDIAQLCNVSKSSVSRYLNNGYVSKEKAAKIKAAIEETGFQTNFFAARLKSKRSHLIGILVSKIDTLEKGNILSGITKKLSEKRYQGMILMSDGHVHKEAACINSFHQQGVDAIIIVDILNVEIHKELLKKLDIPVLYANQICTYANALSLNEIKAGTLLGEFLLRTGQISIAYINKQSHASELRKDAILSCYQASGVDCVFHVIDFDGMNEQAYAKAKKILSLQVDVVLCDGDEIAQSIMKYFQEMQIKVPYDVSVVSFGGQSLGRMLSPSLTSIVFDYEVFGENLAKTVIKMVENQPLEQLEVPLYLVERESVCQRNKCFSLFDKG